MLLAAPHDADDNPVDACAAGARGIGDDGSGDIAVAGVCVPGPRHD